MYKRSDCTKPAYKTAEVMKILNVSYDSIKRTPSNGLHQTDFIKRYDKTGKLPIKRTETGRRTVLREDSKGRLAELP